MRRFARKQSARSAKPPPGWLAFLCPPPPVDGFNLGLPGERLKLMSSSSKRSRIRTQLASGSTRSASLWSVESHQKASQVKQCSLEIAIAHSTSRSSLVVELCSRIRSVLSKRSREKHFSRKRERNRCCLEKQPPDESQVTPKSRQRTPEATPRFSNMASYASKAPPSKNQLSVLAQAKPALIHSSTPSGLLGEKLAANQPSSLRFSPKTLQNQQEMGSLREAFKSKLNLEQQKFISRHTIEDESVIQKQNGFNQMRQAAVMAAVASQQKVRLSATERLALGARRPPPPAQPKPGSLLSVQQQYLSSQPNPYHLGPPAAAAAEAPQPSPKPALQMPTLETLLAVQRQLQQHTKRHLTANTPPQMVRGETAPADPMVDAASLKSAPVPTRNKPLPPSPPREPFSLDSYEKELPPLPASVSPSTSTDESPMSSLDSQSSPATSLVSIPPPPPPILSYMPEPYEAPGGRLQGCSASSSSNASTPSTTISSGGDLLSGRQFQFPAQPLPPPPVESFAALEMPSPPSGYAVQPALGPKAQSDAQMPNNNNYQLGGCESNVTAKSLSQPSNRLEQPLISSQTSAQQQVFGQPGQNPAGSQQKEPQMNYQEHLFTRASLCGSPAPPPPLGPAAGFDEPDFRFPTPPLPDPLLEGADSLEDEDDDDDDDDFQCRIPTPPPHKSMSTASFGFGQSGQPARQSDLFNSSTFSAPVSSPVPAPLFRPAAAQQPAGKPTGVGARQLTVHISTEQANNGGLLAKPALSKLQQLHNGAAGQQHLMMGLAPSSSSPSSSSDGDGQSSNASSSTSGIHSSMDSSSSLSTGMDFNYSAAKLLRRQLATETSRDLSSSPAAGSPQAPAGTKPQPFKSLSSLPVPSVTSSATSTRNTAKPSIRPALKQKKSVSFSDKVELVACAEEQSEDHLPNPLLARVLAGKLQ